MFVGEERTVCMKLIVSDLDGTLLMRGEERLNRTALAAVDYALSKDIVFAVASGRSYTELKRIFKSRCDKIYFLPSDGALCVYREETLFDSPIEEDFDSADFAAHGKYVTYLKSEKLPLIREHMKSYGGHVMRIGSLSEKDGPIYKITDFSKEKKEAKASLSTVYKSLSMTEYVKKGTNKGEAVGKLASMLNISKEDIFAFGDGENDICMFNAAASSFAVSAAPYKVKRAADKVCESFGTEIKKII